METIWKVISCFVALLSLELCCGLPIGQDLSYQDEHTQFLTGLIAVLLTVCGVVCLAGCLCCQRRNGFKEEDGKEFRDSPVVVSVASQLDHGHVNPIANGEFTIFTPLSTTASPSSPSNSNVFSAHQQIISRAQEDYKDGDIDVSDWYGSGNVDFPRAKLKYIREVGRGWFGRVVEGTAQGVFSSGDESAWSPVVVRILEATATNRQRIIFLHDASIYKCPSHPNILKLLGRSLENVPLLLLQEHCENGDLKAYLRAQQQSADQFLTGKLPLLWCKQLTSAVRHLHEHDLIHPDLAARNCRLTHDLTLRLGDYGCGANDYPEDYYNGSENVPVRWCAPECVTCTSTTIQTKKVTRAGNVWSLGICFWEIEECAKQPYGNLTDDEVVSQVFGTARVRLPKPNCVASHSDHLYRLMQLCWAVPESRPTANQIEDMLENIDSNDFDSRWDQMKPNIIIRGVDEENDLTNITVLNMGLNTDDDSQDGKYLSASMHNLAGSLDNLLEGNKSLDSWAEEDEEHTKLHFELGPLDKIQSSGSETEDENWKRKIELGLYTEKVRQKSRSVADLMVLTHIDCSESDSETPLPSLGYKNVRCHNLEDPSQIYGSEGNLLNVHTTFEEELKKLKEDRRDSLLFVPDKIELPTSTSGGGGVYDSPESRRLLEDLNSTSTLEPQAQFFNIYNVVAISPMYSPIRMNYNNNNDHSSSPLPDVVLNAIPSKIPKLSEIIENNIAVSPPDSEQVYKLREDLVNNCETSEFTDINESDDAIVEAKNEILIAMKKSNGENGDVLHTEAISIPIEEIPKICESFIAEAINQELLNGEKIAQQLSSLELVSPRKNGDCNYPIEIIKEKASHYKLSEDEEDSENSTNENCPECLEIINYEERSMTSEIDYLEEQLQLSELLNREQIDDSLDEKQSVSSDFEDVQSMQISRGVNDDLVESDEDDISELEQARNLAEVLVNDIMELATDVRIPRKEQPPLFPNINYCTENMDEIQPEMEYPIESVESGYNVFKQNDSDDMINDAQMYPYFNNLTDDDKLFNIDTEEFEDAEKQDTASYNEMKSTVISKEKCQICQEDHSNDMKLLKMFWKISPVMSSVSCNENDINIKGRIRNRDKNKYVINNCCPAITNNELDTDEIEKLNSLDHSIRYNNVLVWPDLEKEENEAMFEEMLETRQKIAKINEEILKNDEAFIESYEEGLLVTEEGLLFTEEGLLDTEEEITENDGVIAKTNIDIHKIDYEIEKVKIENMEREELMKALDKIKKIEKNVFNVNVELVKGQEEIMKSDKTTLTNEEDFLRTSEEILKNDKEIVRIFEQIERNEEDIMKKSDEIINFEVDIAKREDEEEDMKNYEGEMIEIEDSATELDEELVLEQKGITDNEKSVMKNEEEILKYKENWKSSKEIINGEDVMLAKEEDKYVQNETCITSNEEVEDKVTKLTKENENIQNETYITSNEEILEIEEDKVTKLTKEDENIHNGTYITSNEDILEIEEIKVTKLTMEDENIQNGTYITSNEDILEIEEDKVTKLTKEDENIQNGTYIMSNEDNLEIEEVKVTKLTEEDTNVQNGTYITSNEEIEDKVTKLTEEDENMQNGTYITSNEKIVEFDEKITEELVKGQEEIMNSENCIIKSNEDINALEHTQVIEGAIKDDIVSSDEHILSVDEEPKISLDDNSCLVYDNTINKTQDFLKNEISNYVCDDTPKKNCVNFDLSNSQEEIKNSQFMFLKSSTPYKRDGSSSTVILGASDDFSIDYYNGLKTTTVAASPTQDDSTFVHRKNDHLKYSLETWDNFLGKSFDEQQDRYTSDEPQSLLFLDDSIKSLPCDETYAAAKTYTTLNDMPVELDDIHFEVDDGEEEEKSTYDNWDGGASGGWFLHPQTNGDDLTGQLEIPQDDSYVRFSMDDEVMAAIRNELLTKLPQAQRSAVDLKMDDVGEYETTDRNEVFIKYNVYNTPLSPIPEESHSELLHSGQSTPHCTINTDLDDSDSNDSDWSEAGSTGQHSLIEDECESPRLSPSSTNKEGVNNLQHRHTPSQESCCSNDTLFNLEELQCNEEATKKNNNTITETEPINSTFCVEKTCDIVNEKEDAIEFESEEDANEKADDLQVVAEPLEEVPQQPDFVLKVDNTNCAEALTSLPVESSSSSETYLTVSDSLCYTLQNVAPLNSPEDRPWKHIEASLTNAATCDEEDQNKPQDNLYENVEDTTNKMNILVQQTEIYDYIEKAPAYVNDVVAKEDIDIVNPSTYVNCGNHQEGYVNCPETENVYDGVYEPVYDYCPLADIRFTGPSDSQMMTTSFSDSADLADERDWDSGSDTRSSSSGEFIWKEGSHEASVKALHAAPQDNTREDLEKPEEDSSSCGSEEDGDGPEFVPSAWDKYATPTKSALRSPEKTLERSKGRGVSFKKQKYHCVYEYPREPDSPVIQSYDIWTTPKYPEDWELETFMNRTDTKTSSPSTTASTTQNLYQTSNVPDFIGSSMLEDDFYISSSAKPFDVFGNNCQFFPGKDGSCEWGDLIKSVDNVTPDSGTEDAASVPKDFTSRRPTVLPLKNLAQMAVNRNKCKNIGGLRHTRDKLKLDLPPSPSAFTKGFTMEPPPVEPIIGGRQVPTFSTFGKSRFVVQHVDTPPSEENTKNVSFEALPYKPLVTAALKDAKTLVESVRGEASLLDSADEDSGIESCTLERRKSVS